MTQFARPDATVSLGTYTVVGAATAHAATDETTLDTADYVESVGAPAGAAFEVELAAIDDPVSHTNHVLHVVLGKDQAGGARIDWTINFSELTTLIASPTVLDVPATPTDYPLPLTEGQMAAITGAGYAGTLRVEPVCTQV